MGSNESVIIELQNVSKRYDRREVLSDVNISIYKGDFLAVTGPNGGGKTTFLRILLKLLKPTSGKVIYFPDNQFRTGYLPQKNMIDSRFPISVYDVVSIGMYGVKGLPDDQIKARIEDVLHRVGMLDYTRVGIGELSGGQLQRVLLARAIVSDPEFLVLDEPLSYLDKKYERRIYDIISEIADRTTIVLVSHEMSTIASMANRHIIVDHDLHFCNSAQHFIHYDCCDHH